MSGQRQLARYGPALVQRGHQLADAEDQDIGVEDRRPALDAGRHGQGGAVMVIADHTPVGARGQREDRMFHRGQVVLGHRHEEIANEEVLHENCPGARPGHCHRRCGHALVPFLPPAVPCQAPFRLRRFIDAILVIHNPPVQRGGAAGGDCFGGSDSGRRGIGIALSWDRIHHRLWEVQDNHGRSMQWRRFRVNCQQHNLLLTEF